MGTSEIGEPHARGVEAEVVHVGLWEIVRQGAGAAQLLAW